MRCKLAYLAVKSVFGYNLQSVVRALAIYDFFVGLVLILLSWAKALDNNGLEISPVFGKWGAALIFGTVIPIIRMTMAAVLFKGCKSRNSFLIKMWLNIEWILLLSTMIAVPFIWNGYAFSSDGLPSSSSVSGARLIGNVFVLACFTIWNLTQLYLVYCFLLEMEFCGKLNVPLSHLSDKQVQDLQRDLFNVKSFRDGKIKEFNISIKNLKLDEDRVLGSGSFGTVYKAFLQNGSEMITVATKSVQKGKDTTYFKTLLEEFAISAYLGNHENVVKMIGACTDLLAERKLYLVMEYCVYGSLSDFLKSRRSLFVSFVNKGFWTGASGYVYANIKPSSTINTLDLLKWCYDISKGMEFLEVKKVIHGDLAARNVLLDQKKVAKISDFGFSKKLYEYKNVIRNDLKTIPWRWMALEALTDMEFSTKSDTWSYGCTVWEIFSLAEIPFSSCVWNSQFIKDLESGELRLERPLNATHEVYDLMYSCWNRLPKNRPEFSRLSLQLGEMVLKYTSPMSPPIQV